MNKRIHNQKPVIRLKNDVDDEIMTTTTKIKILTMMTIVSHFIEGTLQQYLVILLIKK